MSVITYTANARATLMSGHTAGVSYSFEINFMQHDKKYLSPKTAHQSLGGVVETVLRSTTDEVDITMGLYDSTDVEQIEEFIKSVAAGETFTIDLDGTIATPDAPLNAVINGNGHKPQRYGPRTYSLSFSVYLTA